MIAIGIGIIRKFECDENWKQYIGFLCIIVSPLLGMIIKSYPNDNLTPTALDVYRGKTTLQITYRDSIPVDSVVVFK